MSSLRSRFRWRAMALFAMGAGALGANPAWSAPVSDALDRPAVMSAQAERSVLLGAAQAGKRLVAVGERGVIVISDDGASTWQQMHVPVSVTLTAVRFADAKHGYLVGHGGTVLTTEDGGKTWTLRLDGRRAAQLAMDAAKASGNKRAVREAERLVSDGPDKPFLDVLVEDAQHAVVVGAYGLAFATADGGQTWTSWIGRLDNPGGLHLYAIRKRGEHILIAGERGLVRLSEDGGEHFTALTTPYEGSFFTAELPSDRSLVVAGLRGNVWRSNDNGAAWKQVPVPMEASITASSLLPDGSIILANQAGFILGEHQGAMSPLNKTPLPPLNGILPEGDGTVLALDIRGTSLVKLGEAK